MKGTELLQPKSVISVLLTCEHGGNEIPPQYDEWFASATARRALASHRGFDHGALVAAEMCAKQMDAPLHSSATTRLLVELNRSLGSPQLFSEFCPEDPHERQSILRRYYFPFRNEVEQSIRRQLEDQRSVLHLSIHSFTPRLRGKSRCFEFGILFDPDRAGERPFSERVQVHLRRAGHRVELNQPYSGQDDGFTTHLRNLFPAKQYYGIEIEINNRFARLDLAQQHSRMSDLTVAIQAAADSTLGLSS